MFAADLPNLAPAAIGSEALTARLLVVLRATMFDSRLTITPRRSSQIAASCAGALQRYLADAEGAAAATVFGQSLAQEGLGHSSLLALAEVLLESGSPQANQADAARTPARYTLALLAGYMQGREAYLLAEQERTRLALERARANAQG